MVQEYTAEEFAAIVREYVGERPADLEAGVQWDDDVANITTVMTRCLGRGDGYGVYRNEDLGHRELGAIKFLSFGSDAATWEPGMGADLPTTLPDMGGEINWRYQLKGTYRGEMIQIKES